MDKNDRIAKTENKYTLKEFFLIICEDKKIPPGTDQKLRDSLMHLIGTGADPPGE